MFAIGEASRQSGIGIETIRFYERKGILPKADRAANGRRLYSKKDIGRLCFLQKIKNLGFTLTDARAMLELSLSSNSDCAEVSALTQKHIDNIRIRRAELLKFETALVELSGNCADGNVTCPMLLAIQSN